MKKGSKRKKLRSGFTTGTAAAAAAKAAAMALLGLGVPKDVPVLLLNGETWNIAVNRCRSEADFAECTVIKDAGDDPDVTNRAEIGARVKRLGASDKVIIAGGEGVGRVTKPGLEVTPGEPAINPGPRRMIEEAVGDVAAAAGVHTGFHVEIFVPEGEAIARKTLNARLGIIGGISILGTSGVVKPLSHEAYIATIESALSVARACGADTVVCTTGRRSERHAQAVFEKLPAEAFVQIGDYFAESMQRAADSAIQRVVLAAFFGKAIKMAQGAPHTHAARSRLALEELGGWLRAAGAENPLIERVCTANTAREAFFMLEEDFSAIFSDVADRMAARAAGFVNGRLMVRAVLFDYSGNVVADTGKELS